MHARLPILLVVLSSLVACRPSERHEPLPAKPPGSLTVPALGKQASRTAPRASIAASSAATAFEPAPVSVAAESPAPPVLVSAALPLPCPPEMAKVGGACIDKWEAHLVVVAADGTLVRHSPYDRPLDGVRYEARSAAGTVPQAYINRNEAQAACEAAGKRLCSLHEWYGACRGPRGFMYPYGPRMDKKACNVSKPHLLSKMHGNNPRRWKYDEHFNDPKLNQEQGFLARTGAYSNCVSGYGVSDMVGNLHEWISDQVGPSLATKMPLRNDIRKKLRKNAGNAIFMGGFYSTTSEHGRGCAFVTIGHGHKYHDYSTGFRCCKTAQEGTSTASL